MVIANKAEAAIELMREISRAKCSDTAAKRVLKACRILGIEDTIRVFSWIGYCQEDGTPYRNIKRIW